MENILFIKSRYIYSLNNNQNNLSISNIKNEEIKNYSKFQELNMIQERMMLQFKEVLETSFPSNIEGTSKGCKIFKETITDRINFFSNYIELYRQFRVGYGCPSRGGIYRHTIKTMNFKYFHIVGNKNFISDNVFRGVSFGYIGRGGQYKNMYFYGPIDYYRPIDYKKDTYYLKPTGYNGRGNTYNYGTIRL